MSVHSLIDRALIQEIPRSVEIFVPEIVMTLTIISLLLLRMTGLYRRLPTCWIALFGSLLAFLAAFAQFMYLRAGADPGALSGLYSMFCISDSGVGAPGSYFTGLMMHDEFASFFRLGLSLFLVFITALTILSGIPDNEDGQDFYTLLIGSTIGMMMAVGSNHLLMLFLSIEMMSVPSYAMVAFQKGRKLAGEAALKYVVYGSGTAGVMLYGISLICGLLGTASFPEIGPAFLAVIGDQGFTLTNPTVVTAVLGIMMILVGFAFKLSLVPFHFWCPDAFEGASAEVCGFLSVASKAAAFGLLVRFVLAFQATADLAIFFGLALGVVSMLSMTYGNLAAYTQNNLKRMLAYSTIAHAGYMVMAVAAMLVILNAPAGSQVVPEIDAAQCVEGLMYYLAVYLFMNLAAFAIIALIRNETLREDIDAYNGLIDSNAATKVLCVCLAIAFFSLVGIPPFGGFFAKMMIFYAAFKAGTVHWFMWVVLVVGGLNTVFSLFYYLRVLKAVFITPKAEGTPMVQTPAMVGAYVALITIPIVALGMSSLQGDLAATAAHVASVLFQ